MENTVNPLELKLSYFFSDRPAMMINKTQSWSVSSIQNADSNNNNNNNNKIKEFIYRLPDLFTNNMFKQ